MNDDEMGYRCGMLGEMRNVCVSENMKETHDTLDI
jgi:hypothetical protein